MSFTYELDGTKHTATIKARRPELIIAVDDNEFTVSEDGALGEDCVLLSVNGRSYQVWRAWEGERVHVRIGGRSFSVGFEDPIAAAQHEAGGDDVLRADMPGVVVEANCAPGDHVSSGDTLMVIESMKMQINISASRDGIVEAVHVNANETFDKGDELVSLHPEEE